MATLFDSTISAADIQVQPTRSDFEGDFTIVVFPLSRAAKKSPPETAKLLGEFLQREIDIIERFTVVQGFLNLSLAKEYWMEWLRALPGEPMAQTDKPLKIMVEYSSPNTNKPLHLGHVRNNLLGFAVSNILKARGHEVIMANLCNDRGIHICKSMVAWTRYGNGATPESTGMKGDHLVGDFYVRFGQVHKEEQKELMAAGMSEEEAAKKAPIMQEAQQMLLDWEDNEPAVLKLWSTMNGWVYEGFESTYKRMGVHFDQMYYESETYLLGKSIVQEGLDAGVFYREQDGSVWVDLTEEGLDKKLLLRKDGTSVYITQDLGTATLRFDKFGLDRMIYVVGNEQEYHFKVLRMIFKKLGRSWWDQIFHLSYGMVELPHGKMKTREGNVVDADDLMDEMVAVAAEETARAGKVEGMSTEEQQQLIEKVAMGAIKFFLLKADPTRSMVFNPEESIALHGFTGPYVQYSHARIQSILRRADKDELSGTPTAEYPHEIEPEEKELLRELHKQNEILSAAEANLSPALIANYIFEIAKTFSKFYDKCSVLREENTARRRWRLQLVSRTGDALQAFGKMLGISMPDQM